MVSVRRVEEKDALAVAGLLAELGYAASEEGVRDRIGRAAGDTDSQFTFVAEVSGEVRGCVSGYAAPYFPKGTLVCRVTALVVTSLHRTRGIGKALMGAAAAHARRAGCAEIEVTTSEDRAAAHRFYETLGFVRTSRRYLREL
jgi:GNAT superfamily N-acetyltransferase